MCKDVVNATITNPVPTPPCMCNVPIKIDAKMAKPVYMYYGLTNYYQNHRRYVKSRDESQLLGDITKVPNSDCAPFAMGKDTNGKEKPIVPCGAIANSLFDDKITLSDSEDNSINLIRHGIAWESDKIYKFQNPELPSNYTSLKQYLEDVTVSPPNWKKKLWELDVE